MISTKWLCSSFENPRKKLYILRKLSYFFLFEKVESATKKQSPIPAGVSTFFIFLCNPLLGHTQSSISNQMIMKCFAGLSLGFLAAVAHAFVGKIPLSGRSLTRGVFYSLEARPLVPSLTNRLSEARQRSYGRVTPLRCSGDIVWSKVCPSIIEPGRKYGVAVLDCGVHVYDASPLRIQRLSGFKGVPHPPSGNGKRYSRHQFFCTVIQK